MIWIILLSTLVCVGIILLLVMYKEAMRDTVLEHTFIFEEFPKSFQKVNVFFISDIQSHNHYFPIQNIQELSLLTFVYL
ncbi:hypothetical protein ACT4UT_35200, partial [Bacillus sp. B-TM1]